MKMNGETDKKSLIGISKKNPVSGKYETSFQKLNDISLIKTLIPTIGNYEFRVDALNRIYELGLGRDVNACTNALNVYSDIALGKMPTSVNRSDLGEKAVEKIVDMLVTKTKKDEPVKCPVSLTRSPLRENIDLKLFNIAVSDPAYGSEENFKNGTLNSDEKVAVALIKDLELVEKISEEAKDPDVREAAKKRISLEYERRKCSCKLSIE